MSSNEQGYVLVVDDNEMNRDMLSRRLKRQGLDVEVAEDGAQALEMVRADSKRFDLILLDIMMPHMNGYEVLQHLKGDDSTKHIPVIMISAVDDLDSVVNCIEMGAEDYLFKPFNPVLLKARVGASLEKKRLRDQERSYMQSLALMQNIDRELNASLSVEQTLRVMLNWAMQQSGADAGFTGLVNDEQVTVMLSDGYRSELNPQHNGDKPIRTTAIAKVLTNKQLTCETLTVPDTTDPFLTNAAARIIAPILREGEPIALIYLESRSTAFCSDDTIAFIHRLADHAAVALSNAQLHALVEDANNAKSDFVSFIAHELKNPMASIKGYSDLLISGTAGPITESQADFLRVIRSNVNRMAALINDLADISRIEAGQLRLEPTDIDVREIITEVLMAVRSQTESKKQRFLLNIPEDLGFAHADRTRLAQILTNLVSNAHKYTPEGGLIIVGAEHSVNRWNAEGAPKVIHISVQDNGIGISPEDQERLFEKFFRSTNHRALEEPGTGLGLSITRKLVEIQGGNIWFESTYGSGSTFHFTLPTSTKM